MTTPHVGREIFYSLKRLKCAGDPQRGLRDRGVHIETPPPMTATDGGALPGSLRSRGIGRTEIGMHATALSWITIPIWARDETSISSPSVMDAPALVSYFAVGVGAN